MRLTIFQHSNTPHSMTYCPTLPSLTAARVNSVYLTSCNLVDEQEPAAQLHSLALVRSCVQKALGLLRDPGGMASRSGERIHTLLALLGNGQDDAHGNPMFLPSSEFPLGTKHSDVFLVLQKNSTIS